MFRNRIELTPFNDGVAESLFGEKIMGGSFQYDWSFLATLRALTYPRMPQGDVLTLNFSASSYSGLDTQNYNDESLANALLQKGSAPRNMLRVHNFNNSRHEANVSWVDYVEKNFSRLRPGWVRFEKASLWFSQKKFSGAVFINAELKSAIVFVADMDIPRMHCIQSAIPAYLPWYFDPEKGMTETEIQLLQSLRENTDVNYRKCMSELAQKYNFREEIIRTKLAGFETAYERAEMNRVQTKIEELLDRISAAKRNMLEALERKKEYDIRALGLQERINNSPSGDSEIMNYFLVNPKLTLVDVSGTLITFYVRDYLEYYNEDEAKICINNRNSCIYPYSNNGRHSDMERLMRAIFIDKKLRIRFCAAYQFNINGYVSALAGFSGYGFDCAEFTPNPHIDRYACMGDYERFVNEYLAQNDYIGAIEQTVASCKSLNFGDAYVMQEFMGRMYRGSRDDVNMRCIELPDGKVVTPEEAIGYLKQEDNNGKDN